MKSGTRASHTVVEAVASAEGTEPTALEPSLYHTVDPDALDTLIRSGSHDLAVTFDYCGQRVRVDGSGAVALTPAD